MRLYCGELTSPGFTLTPPLTWVLGREPGHLYYVPQATAYELKTAIRRTWHTLAPQRTTSKQTVIGHSQIA